MVVVGGGKLGPEEADTEMKCLASHSWGACAWPDCPLARLWGFGLVERAVLSGTVYLMSIRGENMFDACGVFRHYFMVSGGWNRGSRKV